MVLPKNIKTIKSGGACKGCGSTQRAFRLTRLISLFPQEHRRAVIESIKGHLIPDYVVLKHIWAIRHYGYTLSQYLDDKTRKIGLYLIDFARQYDYISKNDTTHSNVNNINAVLLSDVEEALNNTKIDNC